MLKPSNTVCHEIFYTKLISISHMNFAWFQIMDFLKSQIISQLKTKSGTLDINDQVRSAHQAFMTMRSAKVRGRDKVVQQVILVHFLIILINISG